MLELDFILAFDALPGRWPGILVDTRASWSVILNKRIALG